KRELVCDVNRLFRCGDAAKTRVGTVGERPIRRRTRGTYPRTADTDGQHVSLSNRAHSGSAEAPVCRATIFLTVRPFDQAIYRNVSRVLRHSDDPAQTQI